MTLQVEAIVKDATDVDRIPIGMMAILLHPHYQDWQLLPTR
jgi:hypothetical protein